jgi:hypothetical protein
VSAATKLLDRLPRVKQVRENEYYAGCPAHGSRSGRPIHVTVLSDGRPLIHPFCGCEIEDVLSAMGLSMSDLFDKPLADRLAPSHVSFSARDALEVLHHEMLTSVLTLDDVIAQDGRPTAEQIARLVKSAARIGAVRDLVSPMRIPHAA